MKARNLSTAIALGLLALSGAASAITNVESNASIPFSFSNPGARSLAMGGAFIGAADDATAAFSNPAGLTRLGLDQQFSAEFRRTTYDFEYASSGSVGTSPFDLSGVNYSSGSEDINDLSYLGWVLPKDNWAISFYRHQMVNFENQFGTQPIFFTGEFDGNFVRPYDIDSDLEVVTYGGSFAYNLSDNLSFGLGLSWHDFELQSTSIRYDETRTNIGNVQVQRGDDHDIGYNIGLLYKGEEFSIGATYRSSPEFEYRSTSVFFPGDGSEIPTGNIVTPFHAPDVLGVGLSWRASDRVTMNLDINHVGYSNITDRVDDAFFAGGDFAELIDQQILNSFEIEDSIEPRFGVEYLFIDMTNPLALRAGTWREKQHTLQFVNNPDNASFTDPVSAAAEAVLFSAGDDEMHYSFGMGMTFSSFQIDMAYDHSDIQKTLSLSGVLRF